jgi:hypothetical protein
MLNRGKKKRKEKKKKKETERKIRFIKRCLSRQRLLSQGHIECKSLIIYAARS